MLETALGLTGPAAIRWPRTAARYVDPDQVGSGLSARQVRKGRPSDPGSVCILAVGKMLEAAEEAAEILAAEGNAVTRVGRAGGPPAGSAHDRGRRPPRPHRYRRGRSPLGGPVP